jgi:hypothetical protein
LNFHANITPSTHLLDDLPDNALIFSVPFLQQQQHQIYQSASLLASMIAFTNRVHKAQDNEQKAFKGAVTTSSLALASESC